MRSPSVIGIFSFQLLSKIRRQQKPSLSVAKSKEEKNENVIDWIRSRG